MEKSNHFNLTSIVQNRALIVHIEIITMVKHLVEVIETEGMSVEFVTLNWK